MPYPKAQVPPYPRPVSPLEAEPIPLLPGEDIYEPSSNDFNSLSTKERAVKCQRIEEWGHRYLRGEGVFIMSARLEGPFDGKQWKNPWRKQNNDQRGAEVEVPETIRRSSLKVSTAPTVPRQQRNEVNPFASKMKKANLPGNKNPPNSHAEVQRMDSSARDWRRPRRPNDQQVEDWLRTSKAFQENTDSNGAISPTPIRRTAVNAKRKSLHMVSPSTQLPAFEYRCVSNERERSAQPRELRPVDADIPTVNIRESNLVPMPNLSTPQATDRLSEAIVKSKNSEPGMIPTSFIDEQPEGFPPAPPKHPSLSVDNTDTTNIPPSAQIIPAQELLPSIKIPSSEDKTLDEPTSVGEMKESSPRRFVRPSSPPQQHATELDTQQMLAAMTPLAFSTLKKVPPKKTQLEKLSPVTGTKRKAANLELLKPRRVVKRASFAPEMQSLFDSSQSSIKTSLRVSKGAALVGKSFDENAPPPLFGADALNMDTSDEDAAAVHMAFTSNSLPGLSSIIGGKTKVRGTPTLKSALKSSFHQPASSAISIVNAFTLAQRSPSRKSTAVPTSSTSGQDAQPQAHQLPFMLGLGNNDDQNGLSSIHPPPSGKPHNDADAEFNLEGAIDDLGSYLGTWDAEKEASVLK